MISKSNEQSELFNDRDEFFCSNCMGQNAETGYVELWDGKCPECGRIVEPIIPSEVEEQSEFKIHEGIEKRRQDREFWRPYDKIKRREASE